jgi:hypothetical protein
LITAGSFLHGPAAIESHVVKSNHRPRRLGAGQDRAPARAKKPQGIKKPPLTEFSPKELRLLRMAETNVKSNTGIEHERLEPDRLNFMAGHFQCF